MADKFIRTATFDRQFKRLRLWLSPNMYGTLRCNDLDEAKVLIEETGVPQNLESDPQ